MRKEIILVLIILLGIIFEGCAKQNQNGLQENIPTTMPINETSSTPVITPSKVLTPTSTPFCTPSATPLPVSKYETQKSITINEINFPDEYFREYVSLSADVNDDGILTVEERNNVKSIKSYALTGNEIDETLRIISAKQKELILQAKSLEGVQYFKELEELILVDSASEMTSLEELSLENPKLATLKIDSQNMKKIELGNCPGLVNFSVGFVKCEAEVVIPTSEKLKTVIVSAPLINIGGIFSAINVEELIINGGLTETELDLTKLTELRIFECVASSEVSVLDVSTASRLYKISRIEGVKKLILHNELVEVKGENLPEIEYADNTSSILMVLEKLKSRITILDGYVLTGYSVSVSDDTEKWTYLWEKDKRKLKITCDADANVFYYTDSGADDISESSDSPFTDSELKQKAEEILKIFFPETEGRLTCTLAENEKRISYIFNLKYMRIKDNIPVKGNTIEMRFNNVTGELMYFKVGAWYDETELPLAENIISMEEAKKLISDNLKLTPGYFFINNEIVMVYAPGVDIIEVDAKTAEVSGWLNMDMPEENLIIPLNSVLYMSIKDAPEKYTERIFSPEDQSIFITEEEVKKVVTENRFLYIDEAAVSVNITLYERIYSNGRKSYVYKLVFKESETAKGMLATAYVDAENGELLDYSASVRTYTYKEAKAEKIEVRYFTEQKKEIVEDFLREVNPKYFNNITPFDISKKTVLYEISDDNTITRGENFRYCRVVNGIPYFSNYLSVTVDGLSGKIYEYSVCWDENAVFSQMDEMPDEAGALDLYFEQNGCELVYEKNGSGEIVLKYKMKGDNVIAQK